MNPQKTQYVTVLLPAHNEQETIEVCVSRYRHHPRVADVIVVANGCTDATAIRANQAGARVIELDQPGKGAAISVGSRAALTDTIVCIDADTPNPNPNAITHLLNHQPGPQRLVKGTFDRSLQPGPVTDILVKPVLRSLNHPGMQLSQPLSGVMACSTEWLNGLNLPTDFGVDLDILLLAIRGGLEVVEVNIGLFEHRSRSWEHYTEMAFSVARVLHRHGLLQWNPNQQTER